LAGVKRPSGTKNAHRGKFSAAGNAKSLLRDAVCALPGTAPSIIESSELLFDGIINALHQKWSEYLPLYFGLTRSGMTHTIKQVLRRGGMSGTVRNGRKTAFAPALRAIF